MQAPRDKKSFGGRKYREIIGKLSENLKNDCGLKISDVSCRLSLHTEEMIRKKKRTSLRHQGKQRKRRRKGLHFDNWKTKTRQVLRKISRTERTSLQNNRETRSHQSTRRLSAAREGQAAIDQPARPIQMSYHAISYRRNSYLEKRTSEPDPGPKTAARQKRIRKPLLSLCRRARHDVETFYSGHRIAILSTNNPIIKKTDASPRFVKRRGNLSILQHYLQNHLPFSELSYHL